MKQLVASQVCAQCGGELTIRTNPETSNLEIWCPHHPDHHGYVERETYTQAMRRGEDIHPSIRAAIERKMMPRDELGRAMNLLALRYPSAIVDPPTAALFILDCMRLDLDPLISPAEAVPIPFKGKGGKVTVTMVITEDGWLSMAARGCPDRWAGSPSVEPVDDKALAESLCSDPDAWLWKATGRTKDMEPGQTSIAYGYYTHREWDKVKDTRVPAATQPGNQARVRAIKRWVRENFSECRQKMMDITAEWFKRAEGVKAAEEYIDSEYAFISLSEGGDKSGEAATNEQRGEGKSGTTILSPTKAETQISKKIELPAADTEQETFTIDPEWLKQSLQDIHWDEETARTWVIFHFKLKEAKGDLWAILPTLTRDQAQEFVQEIQQRVAQKQMDLF
jgi:hypothetical protein